MKSFRPSKSLLLTLGIMAAHQAVAQTNENAREGDIEEVVVTGSFIRNSQFTNASPIETISTDDIWQSGAANLGEYIRDLPYMENIDTVANILDTADGQQDSNSARFNLRGLGTESTLTLMDGRRTANEGAVASLLPSIAQERIEIVTDGGAALYGADAVAGVANIIPYKEYEGLRSRVYYKRDERGGTEQSSLELMTGLNFDSIGVNWVGAFEYSNRTSLMVAERPRYLEIADQDSSYGNPGAWRSWGSVSPLGSQDPSCATFNDGAQDLSQIGALPSGTPASLGRCFLYFGEWQDFARPSVNYTLFNNFTYEATDWLNLEFQMSHNYRESQLMSSPSNAVTPRANQLQLRVPASHPANPFNRDVMPYFWRPFTKIGTLPSVTEGNGYLRTIYPYYTDAYKFGGDFEIGDTSWRGQSWVGYQQSRRSIKDDAYSLSRMSAALRGQGGPNGNEWFNPFGSADPRSPFYEAGVTDNSQELVDWLLVENFHETDRTRLTYWDTVFDGEVIDLPTGTVLGAVGFQIRKERIWNNNSPLTEARDSLTSDITAYINPIEARDSNVRSAFVELEIPLLQNSPIGSMGIKAAARQEDFYTLGYKTTKPKVSLLWEPLDSLALRASYGESFLAPSASQLRPALIENCTDVTHDNPDPITGLVMTGLPSCSSGNPNLGAEESEIVNVGFSWLPIEGLSIDLDYQEIEYFDKIQSLTSEEVTTVQFNDFLAATNYTAETYDPSNPSNLADGIAWVQSNPNPLVLRDSNGAVNTIIRAPINYASQFVEGFDLRVRYGFSVNDWGRFSVSFSGNYYTRWEYQQSPTSPIVDARGSSNSDTAFAPPISKWKGNLGLNWFNDNHSVGITTRYLDSMIYDETTSTLGYNLADYPEIRAITKVDARYSYRFTVDRFLRADANLTLGISNLFDRMAQRLPQNGGMETRIDDPFGRQFYMSVDFEL
ncbi:TonB-dependent receptor [Pseudohongiella sp. SYSU M77423]|uniref:TonB-dependent receptor domain-containing protein n=1 Tax=Pseudohongiella sp. SYSU M77423 TaxID=3042312 RepID=UPI00247FA728|nr:TonB-dependent receptor [Pseudohongiella sp. SYSU M77423]MDH7944002.1 TonB-dependent receptor [Pseudohongiella sp. SYSU M77423]